MANEHSTSERACRKCGVTYPLTTEYFRQSKSKSGNFHFRRTCRKCEASSAVDYYYANQAERQKYGRRYHEVNFERDAERKRQRTKEWREANPERAKEGKHNAYIKNRDHYKAKADKWRKENYDRYMETSRARLAANPAIWKVAKSKRRALKRLVGGTYSRDDLHMLYNEQEGRCAYCGITLFWSIKGDIHVDHVIPLSRGGSNSPDNLALACQRCNCSKKEKLISEWEAVRGW